MPHGSGGWGLLSVVCSQGVGPALLRFLKTKEPGGKEGPRGGGGITLPGSAIAGSSRTTRILSYNGIPTQHSFFEIPFGEHSMMTVVSTSLKINRKLYVCVCAIIELWTHSPRTLLQLFQPIMMFFHSLHRCITLCQAVKELQLCHLAVHLCPHVLRFLCFGLI